MKRFITIVIISVFAAFTLNSCVESFTSGPTAQFVQLDNQSKWYPVYDSLTGNPVMAADSIYRKVNGETVKVGVNPRQVMRMGKDSAAFVRPNADTVNRVLKLNPWKEVEVIIGIIFLLLTPVAFWVLIKIQSGPKISGFAPAAVAMLFFYVGMNSLQRKKFDASHANTKQITMDQYRHYFSEDPAGTQFWDSVIAKGAFIIKTSN